MNLKPTQIVLFFSLIPALAGFFGQSFASTFQEQSLEPPHDQPQDQPQELSGDPANAVAEYEEEISRLESEAGPYDPTLIEALSGLGELYLSLNRPVDAATAFEDALFIARVSDGLLGERQVPLLKQMIASNSAAGNWEEVDNNHHLAYHIQTRIHQPGDEGYADAVAEYGNWKLDAYREGLLGTSSVERVSAMNELNRLYDTELDKMQAAALSDSGAILPVLYGKARTEYELATHLMRLPVNYFDGSASQYIMDTVCERTLNSAGELVRSCYTVKRKNPRYRASQHREKQYRVQMAINAMQGSVTQAEHLINANPEAGKADRPEVSELKMMVSQLRQDSRRPVNRLWF